MRTAECPPLTLEATTLLRGRGRTHNFHSPVTSNEPRADPAHAPRPIVPVWSVLFPSAAALVTDAGGIFSHAPIAREYGVAAVAASGNATERSAKATLSRSTASGAWWRFSGDLHEECQHRSKLGRTQLVAVWGMTEVAICMSTLPSDTDQLAASSDGCANHFVEVRIGDESNQEMPAGMEGRLVVRTPAQHVAYFQRPDLYADSFRDGGSKPGTWREWAWMAASGSQGGPRTSSSAEARTSR